MRQRLHSERGQAAVEFVAVLPFVMLAALVAWQFVLVGHIAWDAAGAAPGGGRAAVVGGRAGRGARRRAGGAVGVAGFAARRDAGRRRAGRIAGARERADPAGRLPMEDAAP